MRLSVLGLLTFPTAAAAKKGHARLAVTSEQVGVEVRIDHLAELSVDDAAGLLGVIVDVARSADDGRVLVEAGGHRFEALGGGVLREVLDELPDGALVRL